ncbi:hypothetical protein PsorP6_007532 [Peronosclerospora sorghi]|uniref:Uncharacterized protein n=1 Tax=Peronosclerospora sorghi TaxID=230839 RepID=A0ACC0W911_9STRA|nr:hypothetical protein PsorP6_007532 [Peronosclerospora sorghi]
MMRSQNQTPRIRKLMHELKKEGLLDPEVEFLPNKSELSLTYLYATAKIEYVVIESNLIMMNKLLKDYSEVKDLAETT